MAIFINFVVFQLGWLASVIGGAEGVPWAGVVAAAIAVALHVRIAKQPANEIMLLAACAALGAVFDSALVTLGLVSYPSGMFADGVAPYWIIAMWVLFGTTLNVSLRWLRGSPLLASVLGLIAAPLAYYGGEKLGGISLLQPTSALVALGVGWAVMLPVLTLLAERLDGMSSGRERAVSRA
jgi:hypothetical protein